MPRLKLPPYEIEMYCKKVQRNQYVEINYHGLRFRIIKTDKGWISEIGNKNFWGEIIWKPYIRYNGLNEPYPYSTDEKACSAVLEDFNKEVLRYFYQNRV